MSAELWTYQDVADHLTDALRVDQTLQRVRQSRRAILAAYRDLAERHNWTYYYRRGRVVTNPVQTLGTVTYTAATRQLVLTGATWPTWASFGTVRLNNLPYNVDAYVNSTTITLDPLYNPGVDIAAGAGYLLYRDTYPLPADFGKADAFIDLLHFQEISEVKPSDWVALSARYFSMSIPRYYCFTENPKAKGQVAVRFSPGPSIAYTYDFIEQRRPTPLRTFLYSTGTVSSTSGSTTVTGSGTAFASLHAGSLIRLSPNGTVLPTSPVGAVDGTDNPAAFQGVVASVTNSTSLELQTAADVTLSAVKFTLSDLIDIQSGPMFTLFLRWCEEELCRQLPERSSDEINRRAAIKRDALRDAMAADAPSFASFVSGMGRGQGMGSVASFVVNGNQ